MKIKHYECPKCGKQNAVDILYGMPTGKAFKMAEEGKLVIGGCCQEIGAPDRSCLDCKHEWDSTAAPPILKSCIGKKKRDRMMKKKSTTEPADASEPAEVSDAFDFNNSAGWHSIVEGSNDYLLKIMKGKCCEHCGDSKDLSFKISAKTLTIRCVFCHCVHIFPIEILDT